jgi:AcrR family transcriptional regulator
MARDAQETKRKLLRAATFEFAEHGIAGARVDRIALDAAVNKALIYSYFGSKDELFDAVFAAQVVDVVDEVPINAADLPGYAGRLFDRYIEHPHVVRLALWDQLERGSRGMAAAHEASAAKVEAITESQRSGEVSTRLGAEQVLALITVITGMMALQAIGPSDAVGSAATSIRESVVIAVARLSAG